MSYVNSREEGNFCFLRLFFIFLLLFVFVFVTFKKYLSLRKTSNLHKGKENSIVNSPMYTPRFIYLFLSFFLKSLDRSKHYVISTIHASVCISSYAHFPKQNHNAIATPNNMKDNSLMSFTVHSIFKFLY